MSGSGASARTVTPIPTRPMKECDSASSLPLRSWSFINPAGPTRTSAGSPTARRLSSCGVPAKNRTLTRFFVSFLNCSATFTRPGSSATALKTLISVAQAAPATAHDRNAATTLMPDRSLVDACLHEQRLALEAAEIAHEDLRELGIRRRRHRRGGIRSVVLHLGRQRPDEFQALLAVLQDFGDRPEADLPAFALEHVLHHGGGIGVACRPGFHLLVDAHFFEQVLQVNAAGRAVEHDRFGGEHRALERFAARGVGHGGSGPHRHAQSHPPEVDAVRRHFAGEFVERGGGRDHHVEGLARAYALADLGRGVESDIHRVAGLLLKGGGGSSQARLDCAGAQDPDLSGHRAARSQGKQRTQQQTRRDLHFLSPRNRSKLPQAHSARAPESFTTFAHFGISRAMYSAKSCGVPVASSAPSDSSRSRRSRMRSARTMSALSRSTRAPRVAAGTTTPCQVIASKPGTPDSELVGSSGTVAERCAAVTASARSRPPLLYGIAEADVANISCAWRAMTSARAGWEPLFGVLGLRTLGL